MKYTEVHADILRKQQWSWIIARFDFDWDVLKIIKGIPGADFVPVEKDPEGQGYWRFPLDLTIAKQLRALLGERFIPSRALKNWGRKEDRAGRQLRSLSLDFEGELKVLPELLPKLAEALHIGPRGKYMTLEEREIALKEPPSFQMADVAFMAMSPAPMNSNQPGIGKTIETIGGVFEAGAAEGANLVVAPVGSLELVWVPHLLAWQEHPVFVVPSDRKGREAICAEVLEWYRQDEPFWLVLNPAMITYQRVLKQRVSEDDEDDYDLLQKYPELFQIEWETLVVDEFHQMGLSNPATLTSQAMNALKAKKKVALSGTPIGGKAHKLYGVLHFLRPDRFSNKWRFFQQWFEVDENEHGNKSIGGLREDRQEAFYEMLAEFVCRRTKAEVAPWLPDKDYIELSAVMTDKKQLDQYVTFAREAELRIDEENLTATSILAEYTRLRQFAIAEQTFREDGKLIPTTNSCKLPLVYELLADRGIGRNGDLDGDEKVVIFSQFTEVVKMMYHEFLRLKIPCGMITGDVSRAERTRLVTEFQNGSELRVMLMNTKAGGVSIELDRASTVIFMDETWNPDDMEQAEDRVHRTTKTHQVTIYIIRTRGTIEEFVVAPIVKEKAGVNFNILDARRKGLRAI